MNIYDFTKELSISDSFLQNSLSSAYYRVDGINVRISNHLPKPHNFSANYDPAYPKYVFITFSDEVTEAQADRLFTSFEYNKDFEFVNLTCPSEGDEYMTIDFVNRMINSLK